MIDIRLNLHLRAGEGGVGIFSVNFWFQSWLIGTTLSLGWNLDTTVYSVVYTCTIQQAQHAIEPKQ